MPKQQQASIGRGVQGGIVLVQKQPQASIAYEGFVRDLCYTVRQYRFPLHATQRTSTFFPFLGHVNTHTVTVTCLLVHAPHQTTNPCCVTLWSANIATIGTITYTNGPDISQQSDTFVGGMWEDSITEAIKACCGLPTPDLGIDPCQENKHMVWITYMPDCPKASQKEQTVLRKQRTNKAW